MLSTKALQPRSANQPAAPAPVPRNLPTVPPVLKTAPAQMRDLDQENPLRKIAFRFGLVLLFFYVSVLPEVLLYVTQVNTYLLYLIAPPAILGVLFTGGLRRTLRYSPAWYLAAFVAWMAISMPFSYWKGGSTELFSYYVRISFPLLFVVGGGAVSWKEIRAIFYTIAIGGVFNLLTTQVFSHADQSGRTSIDASGTIGNSNDLAAHLLLVLPFILYVITDRTRAAFIRYPLAAGIAYGAFIIIGTASRGALVATAVVIVFMLWRATPVQRMLVLAAVIFLGALIPIITQGSVMNRLGSLFGNQNNEAEESADFRKALFKTSVRYTLEHPLLGVGPGQFANFEGNESRENGIHGAWHETHCSWTQVSAECGIPALIFFVLAIGSAMGLVNRTWREARKKGFKDIANACFCYLVAMVGFLVAISFLSNAYRFYFPVMIGLAIAIRLVAVRQMATTQMTPARSAPLIPAQPLFVG